MSARERFPGIHFLEQHNGGYGPEAATILNVIDDLTETVATLRLNSWSTGVFAEVGNERIRAHRKHGPTSMESCDALADRRLRVLVEEVGEVARALNDAEHDAQGHLGLTTAELRASTEAQVRAELVQVAAMAVAWIAALDGQALS